jgi:ATP-binding cassette subfamily F protein 3
MIQLDGIKRQFGSQVLFEKLTWMIPARARLGLVGPNGTGKTTLLRMLAGLEDPDEGCLHKPRDLQIGYLPQEVESVADGNVLDVVISGSPEIPRMASRLEELESLLVNAQPGTAATVGLTEEYGELRQRFEQLEGDRLQARAEAILSGLGIPAAFFHEPLSTLSGGWRMRVVLARLLLGSPRLLLLDEPTNHLDLEAISWLESFLEAHEGAFVIVSHDRYFLNRLVGRIVELERGRLTEHPGNYDSYMVAKAEREELLEKQARRQARDIAKVERFIERFRYKNTKAKQVQSRIKALGKVERVETAASVKGIGFGFPPAPRSGDIVVRAESIDKRYGETIVYDAMDFLLRRGDRVALVGPNGSGKSTLLKMLAGKTDPTDGRMALGHNVSLNYYGQHQLEELDPKATVLAEVERAARPEDRPGMRKLLARFLFRGEDVEKKVAVLSGGEKARLAWARMLLRPANLLLLDEPTNHLDLKSCEVLEDAINEYTGTLIVISHDRYFINRVVTRIGKVGNGGIEFFDGDYDEYLAWSERRAAERETDPSPLPERPATARDLKRSARREEAEERNRQYRVRQKAQSRLAPLEGEISALEQKLEQLAALQADPAIYSDPQRAGEVGREHREAESRLGLLYAEWEAIAAEPSEE